MLSRFTVVVLVSFALLCSAESSDSKVVLITGASSGIGYVTAKYLASKGMKVVLTARREAKLKSAVEEIQSAGGEAMYLKLDVTKDEDHVAAYKAAEEAYGGIDYIFANAGYEGILVPLEVMETSEMQKIMDINVLGMLKSTKFGLPYLKKRGGGAIISVSSIAGTMGKDMFADPNTADVFTTYCASKAATDMFARAFVSYQKDNIRFYNVKPGLFSSEMVDRIANHSEEGVVQLSYYNPFFPGLVGNPINIAQMVEHMFVGTSLWKPGQNVVIDNDGTWDAHEWYKTLELQGGVPSAEELKKTIKSVSGGTYECTTPKTCQWYNGEAGPLKKAKEEL